MKQTSGKLFTKIVCMILCLCMLTTSLASCGVWDVVIDIFTPDDSGSNTPGGDISGGDVPGGDIPGGDVPGGGDTPGGDTPGGDTETTYYKVSFAVALEEFKSRVTLPNDKLYEAGTEIQYLPTPGVRDLLFMGWYYDAAMTQEVALTDKVNSDLMLYAKLVDTSGDIEVVEGVYYHTAYDVESDYTFLVKADSLSTVQNNITVENISSAGKLLELDTDYTISDAGDGRYRVSVDYKPGKTYRVNLSADAGLNFCVDGADLSEHVTTLNVLVAKEEVSNLTLADGLIYIPRNEVALSADTPNGLVTVGDSGATVNSGDIGYFAYEGATLKSGDRVAIYEGDIPSERDFDTNNGAVKYLTVTGYEGNNIYKYRVSDSKEVLFIPDIIPISGKTNAECAIKIPAENLDFSGDVFKQLGMNEDTRIEVGDYIAFFDGPMAEGTNVEYARIESVSRDNRYYYIDYEPVSYDDVMATMDVFQTRTETPELSDAQIEKIKKQVYNDAINSGFVEEAADYLVNLYVSSNGLETMPDGTTVRYYPKMRANARSGGSGLYYEVTKCEATPDVKVGQGVLKHFEESDGIRVELILSFEVEFTIGEDGKNKVVIAAEAVFEEEILLSINVDGGAIWEWAWIFPYIADYEMNANIDIGTYTGVSAIAKVYTNNGEEKEEEEEDDDSFFPDFDLDNIGKGDSYEEKAKNIGEELKKLFELNDNIKEEIEGEGEEDDTGNDITEKYAEMMKDANEAWIEIVRVEIYKQSQNLDQFGILWFEIGIDFVVSAQLYIMAGIEVETGVAKRYNFSVTLFERSVKTDVIDLEKAHFSFKFYVMGTAGLKVGFEVELSLALLSSDVASVGVSAELGVSLGIWGYFYFSYEKEAGEEPEIQKAGAMFFEIGIYVEVKFKAHLFNIEKLTYNPTLYENFWPIYSVGAQENVFEFEDYSEKQLTFAMQGKNTLVLPNYIFRMKYLDLKDGKFYAGTSKGDDTPSKVFDDDTESRFLIEISDPRFTYDPETNTLSTTVDVENMTIDETFDITITLTYKHGALAFNQDVISRDIKVTVKNDKEYKYVNIVHLIELPGVLGYFYGPAFAVSESFPFKMGSEVKVSDLPIYGEEIDGEIMYGGYKFSHYIYNSKELTDHFTMPQNNVTVNMVWIPTDVDFTVNIYKQNTEDIYILDRTEVIKQQVDTDVDLGQFVEDGFEAADSLYGVKATVDGVYNLYLNRKSMSISYRNVDGEGSAISISGKAGSPLTPPIVSRVGYDFVGWSEDEGETICTLPETVPYDQQ